MAVYAVHGSVSDAVQYRSSAAPSRRAVCASHAFVAGLPRRRYFRLDWIHFLPRQFLFCPNSMPLSASGMSELACARLYCTTEPGTRTWNYGQYAPKTKCSTMPLSGMHPRRIRRNFGPLAETKLPILNMEAASILLFRQAFNLTGRGQIREISKPYGVHVYQYLLLIHQAGRQLYPATLRARDTHCPDR